MNPIRVHPFQAEFNCGVGPGGFQPGNQCASGGGSGSQKAGASGGGGPAPKNDRVARAIASHKPATKEKQIAGDKAQREVASKIGAKVSGDNEPMDVLTSKAGVEVKTLLDTDKNRVFMRPDSRKRKEAWANETGKKVYTVAIDKRDSFEGGKHSKNYSGHKIYVKEGVGAFGLSTMTKVKNYSELKKIIRG